MAFNPDEYLAKKSEEFNPDTYITENQPVEPEPQPRMENIPVTPGDVEMAQIEELKGSTGGAVLADIGATFSKVAPNFTRLLSGDPSAIAEAESELQQIEDFQRILRTAHPAAVFGETAAIGSTIPLTMTAGGAPAALSAQFPRVATLSAQFPKIKALFQAGGTAALGAAETTAFAPGDSDIEEQAALGGLIGLGGAGAAKVGSDAYQAFMGKINQRADIANLLREGSEDISTAKFELAPTRASQAPVEESIPQAGTDLAVVDDAGQQLAIPDAQFPAAAPVEAIEQGGTTAGQVIPAGLEAPVSPSAAPQGDQKVRKNYEAVNAIDQGFREKVIPVIRESNDATKAKLREMVDIRQKGAKNERYATKNRASSVAGNSALERFNYVLDKNKKAGKRLDIVAGDLKGEIVEFSQPISNFVNDLGEIGVTLDNNFAPVFRGSDIEDSPGAERIIKNVLNRMRKVSGSPDAYELHRMKRFIDEQVTYGKTTEGLTGTSENILKSLRRNIDETLDKNFPEYDAVNTAYAETITAINDIKDVAGRKMDLSGGNADEAVGTLLRRLMSNAQSRINLMDSLSNLDETALKYGAKFEDDIITQAMFADELDRVFGTSASTSLAGEAEKAVKAGIESAVQGPKAAVQGPKAGVRAAAKGAAKKIFKGVEVNEENKFKAINELLGK